jgi:hypothetical protein
MLSLHMLARHFSELFAPRLGAKHFFWASSAVKGPLSLNAPSQREFFKKFLVGQKASWSEASMKWTRIWSVWKILPFSILFSPGWQRGDFLPERKSQARHWDKSYFKKENKANFDPLLRSRNHGGFRKSSQNDSNSLRIPRYLEGSGILVWNVHIMKQVIQQLLSHLIHLC